jgi:hypothetical protein
LNDMGGFKKKVALSQLGSVSDAIVQKFEGAGLVTRETDETGSEAVQLSATAATLGSAVLLGDAVQSFRSLFQCSVLKSTKLYLAMRLYEDGWTGVGLVPAPHKPDGPRVFRLRFDLQPVSYYAALLCSALVFGKGAKEICHDGIDGYYRCLVSLNQEQLRPVLLGLQNRSNAACLEVLKLVDGALGDGDDAAEGAPVLQPEPLALADAPEAIAPDVAVA